MSKSDRGYLEYRVTKAASAVLGRVINKLVNERKGDKTEAVIALWRAADEALSTMPPDKAIKLWQEAILQHRQSILVDRAHLDGVDLVEFGSLIEIAKRIEDAAAKEAQKFVIIVGKVAGQA